MTCLHCAQPTLADLLAAINLLHVPLNRMEIAMARAADEIRNLGDRFGTLSGVVTDIAADFEAFRTAMEAERENLTAEGQAALDEATAKADATAQRLGELDVAVGDADGSDNPPAEPPTDPNA